MGGGSNGGGGYRLISLNFLEMWMDCKIVDVFVILDNFVIKFVNNCKWIELENFREMEYIFDLFFKILFYLELLIVF